MHVSVEHREPRCKEILAENCAQKEISVQKQIWQEIWKQSPESRKTYSVSRNIELI